MRFERAYFKRKGAAGLTHRRKKELFNGCIIILAVVSAYAFRIIGRGDFYPMLFSYLRSFIYIGLFAAWGRASKEIGNEFGVSANLVCAWVSKARKYLKSRPEILALAEI